MTWNFFTAKILFFVLVYFQIADSRLKSSEDSVKVIRSIQRRESNFESSRASEKIIRTIRAGDSPPENPESSAAERPQKLFIDLSSLDPNDGKLTLGNGTEDSNGECDI